MSKLNLKLMAMLFLASIMTFTSCKKDEDETETDPVVVLDGYYIKGAATAYTDFNEKAMMAVTRNEVTQTERASLLELYIPVKATDGFNIVKVAGSKHTTYGPGADFADVTQGTNDEPKVTFQRGTLAETANKFTVPADGMYHVAIDFDLMKVVVVPVHWGVIGAATPNGWGGSTAMTESAFDLKTMTWNLSGMELHGGDWKFRYSEGWKVELDTTFDDGAGNIGVKVNTNFGGAIDALVPGGANIVNSDPGVYDMSIAYTLGSGYSATATKTGGLPLTNWTGVICDAVGTGVSADNTSAIPDPSSWGWGNKLLADGAPVKNGDVYTWTWTNITLEANEGFKLRTEDGIAPTTGGNNFDAGLEAVDHANSSANVDPATTGNLMVTVKAVYTIVLTIDAGDSDKKVITIN
jgi:hypothetical protein